MKIALIDCEEGYASVRNLVDSGVVDLYPARTYDEAKKAVWAVCTAKNPYDYVVLDPISRLADTRILELTAPGGLKSLLNQTDTPRATQANWGDMSNDLIRLERQLYTCPGVVVIVADEGTREDPYTQIEMHAPDLNRRLLKDLYGMSDAVVRLSRLPSKTIIDGTPYERGTRVLRLQDNAQFMAKGRDVIGATRPELMPLPTLPAMLAACGQPPRKILLYGPSGAGKTTLACSAGLEV